MQIILRTFISITQNSIKTLIINVQYQKVIKLRRRIHCQGVGSLPQDSTIRREISCSTNRRKSSIYKVLNWNNKKWRSRSIAIRKRNTNSLRLMKKQKNQISQSNHPQLARSKEKNIQNMESSRTGLSLV
ncbi:unnamed protein product [Paramecium octaurelia]|uniref:Uncharacterized protein n=1 Tax=Paramecium octaurelia TaxID=43137 RepID=A0A8S1SYR4_PAROT|nr:unnamed protein product [Paramecium octaurelia]